MDVTLEQLRAATDPAAPLDVERAASLLSAGTFTARAAYGDGDADAGAAWAQVTTTLVRLMTARRMLPVDDAAIRLLALAALGLSHPETAGWVDLDRVVEATAAALPSSVDKTATRAAGWRDLPSADIYELRKTKNLLAGLARIQPHSPKAAELLAKWAAIRPLLP